MKVKITLDSGDGWGETLIDCTQEQLIFLQDVKKKYDNEPDKFYAPDIMIEVEDA